MTNLWNGTFREPEYWNHFARRLVELVQIDAGARVLDVGTGWKGAVLFPAAQAAGERGQAIGIDSWESSVEQTAAAIEERGFDPARVRVVRMDARDMDFEDASFDVVLSGFVGWADVFDFERCEYVARDKKIEQISRVLKGGGRFGRSAWALQEDNEWMGELLNHHLSSDGTGGDGRIPLWRYSKETAQGMTSILDEAGFRDVRVVAEEAEFVYQDEGEWLAVMGDYGWSSYLEQARSLPPDKRRRFEEDVLAKLSERKDADGIHYTRKVLFALGTK
jgi:SAM-dependent methyltransferase